MRQLHRRRPPGTKRPRLCRECHATATHVEVTQEPAVLVRLDGSILRFVKEVAVYWCDTHSGLRIGGAR